MESNSFFRMIGRGKTLTMVLAAVVCTAMSSCSSDDEESISQNGSETAGQVTGTDGQKWLLSSVGAYTYNYNNESKLTGISGYGYSWDVTYNPFKMVDEDKRGSYSEKQTFYDIAVNGKGYITSLKMAYESYEYDEKDEDTKTSYSLSYDGVGHLTSIKGNTSGWYYEDDEKINGSASGSYTFTWNGNKLAKIVYSEKEGSYSEKEEVTFDYGDNQYPNPCNQFTGSLWGGAEIEDMDILGYIGFLGIAGDYLPVQAVDVYAYTEDGETTSETDTYNYSYTFNSNGTVASETVNGYTKRYSYKVFGDEDSEEVKAVTRSASQSVVKHSLFGSIHQRIKAHKAAASK